MQEGGFDAPPGDPLELKQVNLNSARRLANASNPTLTKVGGGNQVPPLVPLQAAVTNTPGHTIQTPSALLAHRHQQTAQMADAGTLGSSTDRMRNEEIDSQAMEKSLRPAECLFRD